MAILGPEKLEKWKVRPGKIGKLKKWKVRPKKIGKLEKWKVRPRKISRFCSCKRQLHERTSAVLKLLRKNNYANVRVQCSCFSGRRKCTSLIQIEVPTLMPLLELI